MRRVAGAPAATVRRRVPRWLTLLLVLGAAAVTYLAVAASAQGDRGALVAHAPAAPEAPAAEAQPRRDLADRADRAERSGRGPALDDEVTVAGVPAATVFARVDGLDLALPHDEPVAVAFHEASRPDALELAPIGRLAGNDNATTYTPPPDGDGPAYHVLSSRGRARPATSGVDVVVPAGGTAAAPVTGTVVEAREYLLYGNLRDWRVVIRPDARPDLHVVLIHLHEPNVEQGDRVEAGGAALAVVRQLPFASHVDYLVGERTPHVHVEVRPATAPKPHDPNEPAMDAGERLEEVTGPRGSS